MSLFPAYSKQDESEEEKPNAEDSAGPSWLNYPNDAVARSVDKIVSDSENSSSSDSYEEFKDDNNKRKQKEKKVKKNSNKCKSENADTETNISDKNTKSVPIKQITLTRPVYRGYTGPKTKKKKKKDKVRYFTEKNLEINETQENFNVMDINEFMKKTEEFNIKLRTEPNNVTLWMEYVNLQDRGEGTKVGRAEKKLSILDRALETNGSSEELLNEKMKIFESVYPFDKVSAEAKTLLSKYPRNPIGWRWLIQATQFSLSKMTAPGVLQAYEHVLEGLHKSRQHNTPLFLDILLQCMTFLRQAGLWEQLWLLTELYLELTYTTAGSGAFKIKVDVPEEEIQNLEDTILTSGLTLGALWLRTEHLRECVHFIPVLESPDPQRTVFVDDLSGLLFPLGCATYSRLMCQALASFKIPPLPMTDAFYEFVGLKSVEWSLDNVEILLSAAELSRGIVKLNATYLEACRDLLVGPQYLNRERLGAKEFFESLDSLFSCCVNNCAQEDIPSLLVWQIRWWSFVLQHTFLTKPDFNLTKDLRSKAKLLLKKYRQCLPIYTEYAMFESYCGNFDVSLKVLETAVELQQPPLTVGRDRKDICAMYKAFVELLLRKDFTNHKERVIKILVAMAFGEPIKNIQVTEELTLKGLERMSHITTEMIREMENNDDLLEEVIYLKDVALPNETVCWLTCHAWFLYVCKDMWQSCAHLEKAIKVLETTITAKSCQLTIGHCMLESLYETLLTIMNHYCITHSSQYQVLQDMIDRAISHFPNNTYFLHILASTKISTVKWQKISSNFISTKSSLACTILIFILRAKLLSEQNQNLITVENAQKRMSSLLNKLIKEESLERCPLIWRLSLQSTSNLSMDETKSNFYLAVEKCPWVKILYYEAAKMLHEDMPQIQDLLIEKELRLHITPEELEILREGPSEQVDSPNLDMSQDSATE